MYVYGRLAWKLLKASKAPRIASDELSSIKLRILPGDLDTNGHLNNGRYLTLADIGRYDLMVRSGMARAVIKRRWYPVVAAAHVRFRRSLKLFQIVELTTQVVWWDAKWMYIEHLFLVDGKEYAQILLKAVFRKPGTKGKTESVSIAEFKEVTGVTRDAPPMPAWVAAWRDMDRSLVTSAKTSAAE